MPEVVEKLSFGKILTGDSSKIEGVCEVFVVLGKISAKTNFFLSFFADMHSRKLAFGLLAREALGLWTVLGPRKEVLVVLVVAEGFGAMELL